MRQRVAADGGGPSGRTVLTEAPDSLEAQSASGSRHDGPLDAVISEEEGDEHLEEQEEHDEEVEQEEEEDMHLGAEAVEADVEEEEYDDGEGEDGHEEAAADEAESLGEEPAELDSGGSSAPGDSNPSDDAEGDGVEAVAAAAEAGAEIVTNERAGDGRGRARRGRRHNSVDSQASANARRSDGRRPASDGGGERPAGGGDGPAAFAVAQASRSSRPWNMVFHVILEGIDLRAETRALAAAPLLNGTSSAVGAAAGGLEARRWQSWGTPSAAADVADVVALQLSTGQFRLFLRYCPTEIGTVVRTRRGLPKPSPQALRDVGRARSGHGRRGSLQSWDSVPSTERPPSARATSPPLQGNTLRHTPFSASSFVTQSEGAGSGSGGGAAASVAVAEGGASAGGRPARAASEFELRVGFTGLCVRMYEKASGAGASRADRTMWDVTSSLDSSLEFPQVRNRCAIPAGLSTSVHVLCVRVWMRCVRGMHA